MTWIEKARRWWIGYKQLQKRSLGNLGQRDRAALYVPWQMAVNRAGELLRTYDGPKINAPRYNTPPYYYKIISEAFDEAVSHLNDMNDAYRAYKTKEASWWKNVLPYFVDDVEKIGRAIEEITDKIIAAVKNLANLLEKHTGIVLVLAGLVMVFIVVEKVPGGGGVRRLQKSA